MRRNHNIITLGVRVGLSLFFLLMWPNTVLARALVDAIQHMHKEFKKQTCHHAFKRAVILFTQLPHYLLYFSIIACGVLMALVLYYNDMLQKVMMQRTQQFLAFVCCRKNPVKCQACSVVRKIETDCFSRNVPFSSDPVVRISRNLAKKQIRDHVNDLS